MISAERKLIYAHLFRSNSDIGFKYVDIGGNPNAVPHEAKIHTIHLCPKLEWRDQFRQHTGENVRQQLLQEATDLPAGSLFVAIDSLYDISPETVIQAMTRNNCHNMVLPSPLLPSNGPKRMDL